MKRCDSQARNAPHSLYRQQQDSRVTPNDRQVTCLHDLHLLLHYGGLRYRHAVPQ